MMSRAANVVVVSKTVVTGTVVWATGEAVSGGVESGVDNEVVTSSDALEALGVLLTAQADNNTIPSAISALECRKRWALLRAINKYYAKYCYF